MSLYSQLNLFYFITVAAPPLVRLFPQQDVQQSQLWAYSYGILKVLPISPLIFL
jgi:hypothetical protein